MLTDTIKAMINNSFKESFYEKRKKKYFDSFFPFLIKENN